MWLPQTTLGASVVTINYVDRHFWVRKSTLVVTETKVSNSMLEDQQNFVVGCDLQEII